MATGLLDSVEDDCVPLVDSDEELPEDGVVQKVKANEDRIVVIKNRRASEDDQVKATAVRDYFPNGEGEIELKRGDRVEVESQTLDQLWCEVLNKRTSEEGMVPFEALEFDAAPSPKQPEVAPSHSQSSLHRRNVVLKRPKNYPKPRRRTGSFDFNQSEEDAYTPTSPTAPLVPHGSKATAEEPTLVHTAMTRKDKLSSVRLSLDNDALLLDDRLTKSEGVLERGSVPEVQKIPVQFKRLEKFNIVSVCGTDKFGRPVIVFSAVRLPPSYQISHDQLLEYLKYTLDNYVENDYTLVYFHYGLSSVNKPSFGWLYQVYKELERKYKKNLKKLYIVHPTRFVRWMMTLFRPFISFKFGKKLMYINRLEEMDPVLFLDQLDIPEEVRTYDRTLQTAPRTLAQESRSSFYVTVDDGIPGASTGKELPASYQFGVSLERLKERSGEEIPHVMRLCVEYLEGNGLETVGIFRRTPSNYTIQQIKANLNQGKEVNLTEYGDPHIAAVLLKLFLRELPEPLLTFTMHDKMNEIRIARDEEERLQVCQRLIRALPPLNYRVLEYLMNFVMKVVEHQDVNKMSATNLSIVFGPNLLWSQNEVATLNSMSEINRFTLFLTENHSRIF